jgi:hypothetical protein
MATGVIGHPGDRRSDNLFFSGMAVIILASVFMGFAPTYYLAGVFKAPLPNLLVHIHGAVFSCGILLLIVQTSLVAAGRVDVHRRLGLLGFGLACLMVVLGMLVDRQLQRRRSLDVWFPGLEPAGRRGTQGSHRPRYLPARHHQRRLSPDRLASVGIGTQVPEYFLHLQSHTREPDFIAAPDRQPGKHFI